jgi:sterol desaturase/sphingolipid hydroxylase (fatty acid hydroxylase superfamily)
MPFDQIPLEPLLSRVLYRLAENTLRAFLFGLAAGAAIYALERWTGGKTSQYRERSFLHDAAYWFFVRSGLHRLIFFSALFATVAPGLAVFNLRLLSQLPLGLRLSAYWLITEFLAYWIHRWQHRNRFLWSFHATHHSATHLAFVTANRVHPIESFITDTLTLVPLLALGVSPNEWLPLVFVTEFLIALQHSEVRARFGPLYKFVVSPTFHSYHHSLQPEHHNRNFGRILSLWDFVFGTAVDEKERAHEYGVPGVEMATLMSTLWVPFRMIYETYFKKARPAGLAARVGG